MMGLVWSFLNPIFMLTIYTFVFSVVFQAKWGQSQGGGKAEFAIILFAGLIVFNIFAEIVNRAPSLILANANYVKKVVFPLEILPLVAIGATLFHALVSVLVLLVFCFAVHMTIPWTVVFLPVVLFPLLLLTLGGTWFLASLGVYLRDVSQTMGLLTTALLFTSPIFFPISALPESLRPFLLLNPLAFIIEQARGVLIWGNLPDWTGLAIYLAGSALIAWGGLFWFQKTRKGFADVI
jgi:lipopolysaccharide transport system permease protein